MVYGTWTWSEGWMVKEVAQMMRVKESSHYQKVSVNCQLCSLLQNTVTYIQRIYQIYEG